MKTLMATLVLFSALSANASSGQQFREDIRNMAKANNLKEVDSAIIYDGKICSLDGANSMGIVLLKDANGETLAVTDESFFASQGEDNMADSAVLTEVQGCGTRTVRF